MMITSNLETVHSLLHCGSCVLVSNMLDFDNVGEGSQVWKARFVQDVKRFSNAPITKVSS